MDLVVTVPRKVWYEWLSEGSLPGDPGPHYVEFFFWLGKHRPPIGKGERLYIVAFDRLRGYAPVTRLHYDLINKRFGVGRRGGAVAVTIPHVITGFRGYRHPWWKREDEQSFPDWKTEGVHGPR